MNATAARQLVPLIGRARTFRAALVPLLVAALLGWTGYFILAARHLSPEQSAVAAYGSSNGSTEATASIPGERFSPLRASVGAARIDADALSSDVQWAGDGGAWFAMYVEQPYPNPSTEGRLVLDGGRWPRRPGEVVASPGLGLSRGTVVRAARGRWNLTVVGTLRDVWQPDARSLYGAPGTWNRWEISRDQARVTGASPARTVYWSASEPMQAAPEVERAAGAAPFSSKVREEYVDSLSGFRAKPWLERGLPALLATTVGSLAAGALLGRFTRRTTTPLTRLGYPAAALRHAGAVATAGGVCVTLGIAWGGAQVLSLLWRLVSRSLSPAPIGPWQAWGSPLTLGVVTAFGLAVPMAVRMPRPRRARRRPARPRTLIAGAALLGLVAWSATGLGPSFTAVLIVVLCASASAALLVAAVLVVVPGDGDVGPGLLARRLVRGQVGGLASLVVSLATLTAVVASVFSVAAALTAHLNERMSTGMPPGMALFRAIPPETAPRADLHAEFRKDVGLQQRPVRTWLVSDERRGASVLVVTTPDDVGRIFGPLGPTQESALRHRGRVLLTTTERAGAISVPEDLGWIAEVRVSARRPRAAESVYLYTGLTPGQDRAAAGWAERVGVNPVVVMATGRGGPLPVSVDVQLSAAGFGLLVALLAGLGMRGVVRSLRPLMAAMNAAGLGRTWLRSVAVRVGAIIGAAATAGGVLGTGLSVLLVRQILPSMSVVGFPWLALTAVLVGSFVGSVVGARVAAGGLAPRERRA